ncbi:MAG: hypothetical protein ACRD1C_09225 [Terriglobales bacterium]
MNTLSAHARTSLQRQRLVPLALWAAVAAAAALRALFAILYIAQQSHRALRLQPFAFETGNIARALATGHGFASPLGVPSGPTAWVAPVYPSLLAALFRLFGVASWSSFVAATGLNILFATLVCFPLYAATKSIAQRLGGARTGHAAGLIACWLWAVYPNAILLTYQSMWDGCLSALLGIVTVWATLRLLERSLSLSSWIAYGLLWALLLLTNPVFVAVLPVLLACFIFGRYPVRLQRPLIALVVTILCLLPWTIRNRETLHAWVPLRSDLGLALWLGNNPGASVPWHGQQHPLDDLTERAEFVHQGEAPFMRVKLAAALSYIPAHPAVTASHAWLRFWVFWSGGAAHPLPAFLHGTWRDRYVLTSDLLLSLGALLAAILLFRRRHPYSWLVTIFPLLIPCAYYLTLAIPRYRLAIDPEVILLASCWLASRRTPAVR